MDTVILDTASLSPLSGGIPVAARFPAEVEILVSSAENPGDFSPSPLKPCRRRRENTP